MTNHTSQLANGPVTVGLIVRPHGIRGQVVVAPETDFAPERFRVGATVLLERDGRDDARTVTSSREHNGRWVIGIDGVATMNDAEALRGCALRIPGEALHALEAGQFYVHDLIGCRVRTVAGHDVGPVTRVDEMGGRSLLVVTTRRGEVLVPLAEPICREVNLAARQIVIDPPAGLIDLNALPQGREDDPPEPA